MTKLAVTLTMQKATFLQVIESANIVIFTNYGSAMEGTRNGGAGAVISIPSSVIRRSFYPKRWRGVA